MMTLPRISTPVMTAHYNEVLRIVYITYCGQVTPQATIEVYQWLGSLTEFIEVKEIYGGIYDFRKVTGFRSTDLRAIPNDRQSLNTDVDIGHMAIALLVNSFQQEQMVRLVMQVLSRDSRKRVVKSEDEALKFISEWREKLRLA